jgi:3-phosphoshikimate 1-carboxyvinyltransferase
MLASLNTPGQMRIYAKKSRTHTELMFYNLGIPIEIKKINEIDIIKTSRPNILKRYNLNVPGDISSAAFFIVLTLLTKNSHLILRNINLNPSRLGILKILKKMGANIKIINKQFSIGAKYDY